MDIEFSTLSTRALNFLNAAGIDTMEKLIGFDDSKMMNYRNVGRKTCNEIISLKNEYMKRNNILRSTIDINDMNLKTHVDNILKHSHVNEKEYVKSEIIRLLEEYKKDNIKPTLVRVEDRNDMEFSENIGGIRVDFCEDFIVVRYAGVDIVIRMNNPQNLVVRQYFELLKQYTEKSEKTESEVQTMISLQEMCTTYFGYMISNFSNPDLLTRIIMITRKYYIEKIRNPEYVMELISKSSEFEQFYKDFMAIDKGIGEISGQD